jgi:integrase
MLLEFYMQARGSGLKCAQRYKAHVGHLERHLGEVVAAKVRQDHVDQYSQARAGEGVEPKTTFNELSFLRTALRYAYRCDKLREAPRFVVSRPHCERDRVAWPEEAQALIQAADPCLRCVLLAAYTLGLRRGEIIGAQWEWVQGDTLSLPTTKTGRPKTVVLPPHLLSLLREPPVHWQYVFARWSRDGEPTHWHVTTLQRAWTRLKRDVGVRDLTLHDLRRSMSSVAQSRGHAQAAVQNLGGWVEPSTMQRHYSHAHRDQVAAVSQDLEGLLVGNGQVDQEAITVDELLAAVKLLRTKKPPNLRIMSGGKK